MRLKKSLLCVLLAIFMVLPLAACSDGTVTVAEYKDTKIDSNMFSYMLSSQKAYLESMFYYYYQTTDFDSLWATAVSQENSDSPATYGDVIFENIVQSLKMFTVVKQLCKEYGLEVTDQSTIDAIEDYISEDIETAGDKDLLEIALGEYGATVATEREYLFNTSLSTVLLDYLYGDNGTMKIADTDIRASFDEKYSKADAVMFAYKTYDSTTSSYVDRVDSELTDADKQTYFNENYAKAEHILFYFYDTTKTNTKISDDEIAAKKVAAQQLYDKITAGEISFDDAKAEYNEDPGIIKDEGGKLFTSGGMLQAFEDAVFGMNDGDIQLVETDVGMHIIRRNATTGDDYTSVADAVAKALTKERVAAQGKQFYEKIKAGEGDFAAPGGYGEYEEAVVYTDGEIDSSLQKVADTLKPGEFGVYDSDDGYYIIRKLETGDEDYTSKYDKVKSNLSSEAFYTYIESFYPQVVLNEEEVRKFSFATVKALKITAMGALDTSSTAATSD